MSRRSASLLSARDRARFFTAFAERLTPPPPPKPLSLREYAEQRLGLTLTPGQLRVIEALETPPHRVLVPSGNGLGKTVLGAVFVLWFFDTFDPGVLVASAPTQRQIADLLWGNVRKFRAMIPGGMKDFAGPKATKLWAGPHHYATGYTARDEAAFHGHHADAVAVLFDEAESIGQEFWDAAPSMLNAKQSYWLCLYNPLDSSSPAAAAEKSENWNVVPLSALDHPNIIEELAGRPAPINGGPQLAKVRDMLDDWGERLSESTPKLPTDVCLGGTWWRPGPVAEGRILGRRPSLGTSSIWSIDHWEKCLLEKPIKPESPVAIGCDVARFGDDSSVIVVRKGLCVVDVEVHHAKRTNILAERIKSLCDKYKTASIPAKSIPVWIDGTGGFGGGVVDQSDGHDFREVTFSEKSPDEKYANVRAFLWCSGAVIANEGYIDVTRMDFAHKKALRDELLSVRYTYTDKSQVRVEEKALIKRRLGRSPDIADAFLLAFAPPTITPYRPA